MGFFDQILDDSKSSSSTASTGGAGNSSTGTGVSTDDSDILIIDDSSSIISETSLGDGDSIILDSAPISNVSNITAEDIPNTAISFFEDTNTGNNIISEENSLLIPNTDNNEISFSTENIESPIISNSIIESGNIDITDEKIKENNTINNNGSGLFGLEIEEVKEEESEIIQEKSDPNAILLDAIANLQKLLKGHEDIIEDKMHIVENKQSQIANLKQEIKSLTEEAKAIGEEKNKVSKMIELFQSQKI